MTSAIVIGGGIGGLTVALALRRVGIDAQIYEAAEDPWTMRVGGGMTIFHNGMRVLRSLGAHERVQAIGCPMESMRFATARGRLISYWPLGPINRDAGLPAIGLVRAELQEEGARGALIAFASTVLFVGVVVALIVTSENWPLVRERFFSWDHFKAAWPEVLGGFWLDLKILCKTPFTLLSRDIY